jgi:phosphonate transport system substrate-binding protein
LVLAGAIIATALVAVTALLGTLPNTPYQRLRIGVLPDQDRKVLEARYAPLVEYLSHNVGIPCELAIPSDYDELVDWFTSRKIQLAYFGGLTFVEAQARADAVPLVSREIDLEFRSYYLVRADNTAATLADLKGTRFAFGSRLSTSGHLMPRYFMQSGGLRPEQYFAQVIYSGAHDRTAYMVRDGQVDAGVANANTIASMFKDGRLHDGDLRILGRTPPYADYVWAVRPEMPERIRIGILNAFLLLSPDRPNEKAILDSLDANAFLPALSTDFVRLGQIAAELSLAD